MPGDFKKALRDLWLERGRALMAVAAIALGIAAFSTVMSTYAILLRELDQGYLATNPASAVLRTDTVTDELIASVLNGHGVAQAEARRVVRGRIKAGPVDWRTLVLFVVRDYRDIRIARLVPQQGAWPPAAGEILVERDAMQVVHAAIGDSVLVKIGDGPERTLRLSGTVHDVGQAQARMENLVYGYVTLDTLALLGEKPSLDQLTIVAAENRNDEAHVRQIAAALKTWLEAEGHPVRRVDVPKPGKHPHADIMGLLLLIQAAFGLFALLLSGILVVNLLTALLASQVRQIGVMKAIGGTRARIARLYLGQALALGFAAFAVAVPLGMWGSRAFCLYMARFLNFDITSFAVPAWVYLLDAAVGLLLPLLSAAYPVSRGCAVTVREALSDYGVARQAFGTSRLDRSLAGVGGLGRPLLLSIRNSFRRRTRLALTVLTLALAGVFFLAALNLRASFVRTLDRMFGSARYDLALSFPRLQDFDEIGRALSGMPNLVRAEGWITTEASLAAPGAAPTAGPHAADGSSALHAVPSAGDTGFNVVALPAATDLLRPEIVEGRWLRAGDGDVVVVNGALANRLEAFVVGKDVAVQMGGHPVSLRVVGLAREPFTPAQAYVPQALFEARGHSHAANSVRLVLDKKDGPALASVRAELDRRLEKAGLRAFNSSSVADRRYGFDQHMLMIYVFLLVMSGILLGVGGLGLATTMSLNVLERRREMGVLRAIGARPATIALLVVAEGMVVALMSFVLGALAAWPIAKASGDAMMRALFKTSLDFRYEPLGLLLWLVASCALGAAASFLPAWHAARRPVREAIGYE